MPLNHLRFSLRTAALTVTVMCVVGCVSGCADQQTVQFVNYNSGSVVDSFTCLGITDEQWKSVLKPGRYSTLADTCEVGSTSVKSLGIGFQVWGVHDYSVSPWAVPPNWTSQVSIEQFTPAMFYRFPESVGTGGVLWMGNGYSDLRAIPSVDDSPAVFLELYHAVQNDDVVSRGLVLYYSGTSNLHPGDWQKYSFLKGDAIADLVQLAFWAAQGLHAQYPDQFPNPLPAENPSPYVPPADGSLPTSTFTGTPTPPIYITPNPPNPSPSGTPT